jgi:hypothetical protein
LTRQQARRIAIRAQLLDARRPTDLLAVVGHLTFLQLDPTAAIAPSADLVAWTRLGGAYRPEQLTQALERDRSLYEVRAIVRPTADLPLHLAEMAVWPFADEDRRRWPPPGPRAQRWLDANDAFRRDVLDLLRRSGPLRSRDVPDTSVVPWQSSGWTGNRNVTQMLEFLNARGEVAVAGRVGRQRLWDLAERVYPPVAEVVPLAEARRVLAVRRLRALGIARPKVVGVAGERHLEAVEGEPAEVEGTPGAWVVDPAALGRGSRAARRCCRRSTGWSTTAPARRSCWTSTTSSRCTSRRPSGAGATSRCRSSTTTGSSGSWTPSPTGGPRGCGCTRSTRTSASAGRRPRRCRPRSRRWPPGSAWTRSSAGAPDPRGPAGADRTNVRPKG